MNHRTCKRLTVGLICLCLASFVIVSLFMASVASAQGAAFLTGGISEEERAEMDAQASRYDLKLVFISPEGAYLSDVAVRVERAGDKAAMLEVVTTGPWLLVALPGGSYVATASFGGQTQSLTLDVTPGRMNTQYMRFNP